VAPTGVGGDEPQLLGLLLQIVQPQLGEVTPGGDPRVALCPVTLPVAPLSRGDYLGPVTAEPFLDRRDDLAIFHFTHLSASCHYACRPHPPPA